jgi:hypothetical protein
MRIGLIEEMDYRMTCTMIQCTGKGETAAKHSFSVPTSENGNDSRDEKPRTSKNKSPKWHLYTTSSILIGVNDASVYRRRIIRMRFQASHGMRQSDPYRKTYW